MGTIIGLRKQFCYAKIRAPSRLPKCLTVCGLLFALLCFMAAQPRAIAQSNSHYAASSALNVGPCVSTTLDGVHSRVPDFAVNDSGMYYLVHGPAAATVVKTDFFGKCAGTLNLPVTAQELAVGPDGQIAVLSRASAPDGKPARVISIFQGLSGGPILMQTKDAIGPLVLLTAPLAVNYTKKTLETFTISNSTSSIIANDIPLALQYPDLFRLAPAGSSIVVVLELAHNRMHVIDIATRVVQVVNLSAPEIDIALNKIPIAHRWSDRPGVQHQSSTRSTALWGMTASPDGRIFVGLNHFTLADGAPFVEFGTDGARRRSFVCQLPKVAASGEQLLIPSHMQYWNRALYLLDGRGLVVKYSL